MSQHAPSSAMLQNTRFYSFLAFTILLLFGGGSFRADIPQLLILRPAAVLLIALFLLSGPLPSFRQIRTPLILLGLFAVTVLIQLVPLPPSIWLRLPGYAQFEEIAQLAEIDQPWRTISISPDRTLNTLISLLVPAAVLVAFAGLSAAHRALLLPILLFAIAGSAIFGLIQVLSGNGRMLQLYPIGAAVFPAGFFANRNHQAVLLGAAWPLLAAWAKTPSSSPQAIFRRRFAAIGLGVFLIPVILLTGSRSGTVLAGIAMLASLIVTYEPTSSSRQGPTRPLILLLWSLPILMFALTVYFGRAVSIDRFTHMFDEDKRFTAVPTMLQIVRDFFPFGSGAGTFDPVFRMYEPDALLTATYFNHAHDDFLELVLTGGLPAVAVLLIAIIWLVLQIGRIRRTPGEFAQTLALAALFVLIILLAASITDYPIRPPLMSGIAALLVGWVAMGELGTQHMQHIKRRAGGLSGCNYPVHTVAPTVVESVADISTCLGVDSQNAPVDVDNGSSLACHDRLRQQ